MVGISVVQAGRMTRRMRRPSHPFYLKQVPFVIQPFMIAPVLPGETLKGLLLQARVVTDPIKNPLIGWWCEFYVFYVKLRDLYERDAVVQMVLDPAFDPTTVSTAYGGTSDKGEDYYKGGTGTINWVEGCLRRVVDEYFRDESLNYASAGTTLVDGGNTNKLASIVGNSVWDSAYQQADVTAQDVVVEGPDVDTDVEASEIQAAMARWELLRFNNLTTASFEDFIASYGVRPSTVELHRPELIRYVRDWTYPTNTIDPANGTPRSACSWSVSERADKDRFFKEPGFIFGVHVVRPKVYLRNQVGTFTAVMANIYSWLPNILSADPAASRITIADNVGPFSAGTDTTGYQVDIKDLFLYGEQFTNLPTSGTDFNMVPLPDVALTFAGKRFPPSLASIQELFVTGASAYYSKVDGVCSLQIASALQETSPRGGPSNEPGT